MVQIIEENRRPRPPKPPSAMDRFKNAFGTFIDVGSKSLSNRHEKELAEEKMNKENEFARRMFQEDISGLTDPKARQEYFAERFRGQTRSSELGKKLEGNKDILRELERQRGLKSGSLDAYITDPSIAERLTKPPSQGKTALSSQPVPEEVSQAVNQIMEKFPNANADQLKMIMDQIGIPPTYSNGYIENRRRQDERAAASKDKRLEAGQKRAEKVLDRADRLGEELPILESSIMAMEDAVLNGDQSFWSLDNLAEMTGLELFRTAKGGQFKTAAKTYFINDLKSSGARPNMFIEKQLSDALAKVGRSQEANQTVIESFKFSNDLKRKWLETARELENFYENSLGYLPGSFNSRVEEVMQPYVKSRQKEYEERLKELHVQEKNKSNKVGKKPTSKSMIVQIEGPDGSIYETESENIERLPEGYRVL